MDQYPTYGHFRLPVVGGHAVRLPYSARRFVIVSTRPERIWTENGTYVAFAAFNGHSSNPATAIKRAAKVDLGPGMHAEVLDTETGERIFTGPVA